MESPPGCTSSEEEKKPQILSESSDLLTPDQKKSRKRRKRARNRNRPGTRNVSFDEEGKNDSLAFFCLHIIQLLVYPRHSSLIQKSRNELTAQSASIDPEYLHLQTLVSQSSLSFLEYARLGSFIADNNSSDGESELKEVGINEDFDRDYHSRLNDEIQGERERYLPSLLSSRNLKLFRSHFYDNARKRLD